MKKKLLAMLMASVMVLGATACGGSEAPADSAAGDMPTVGVLIYKYDDTYISTVRNALEAALDGKAEVIMQDGKGDQATQNDQLDVMIEKGVDVLAVNMVDAKAAAGVVEKAKEAGIPTVSFDAPPLADTTHDAVVMYDAVEQGYLAGVALRDAILAAGKELSGTIYYGNLPYIHPNAQTREAGFKSAFEGDDVEFVMLTGETPEEFYSAMEGAIMADPDMLGAWGLFSAATWGMYQAIQASGEEILLSSVDCDTVILQGIKDGGILGSTCYAPTEGARLAAKVMVELLNGEEVPGITYQSNKFLDASNVEELFEVYHPGKDPLL